MPLRRALVPATLICLIRMHRKRGPRELVDCANHDNGEPLAEPEGCRDYPKIANCPLLDIPRFAGGGHVAQGTVNKSSHPTGMIKPADWIGDGLIRDGQVNVECEVAHTPTDR